MIHHTLLPTRFARVLPAFASRSLAAESSLAPFRTILRRNQSTSTNESGETATYGLRAHAQSKPPRKSAPKKAAKSSGKSPVHQPQKKPPRIPFHQPEEDVKFRKEGQKGNRITIFYRPGDPLSTDVLELLRSAHTEPFPSKEPKLKKIPKTARRAGDATHYMVAAPPPLEYILYISDQPPPPGRLLNFLEILNDGRNFAQTFFKPKSVPMSLHPTNEHDAHKLMHDHPELVNWPIVHFNSDKWIVIGTRTGVDRKLRKMAAKRKLPNTPIGELYDPKVDTLVDAKRQAKIEKLRQSSPAFNPFKPINLDSSSSSETSSRRHVPRQEYSDGGDFGLMGSAFAKIASREPVKQRRAADEAQSDSQESHA